MRIELQSDPKLIRKTYLTVCAFVTLGFSVTGVIIGVQEGSHAVPFFIVGPAAGLLCSACGLPLLFMRLNEARRTRWVATDETLEMHEESLDPRVVPWGRIRRLKTDGHRIAFQVQDEHDIYELYHVNKALSCKVWEHWAQCTPSYKRK